ncbi:hypothetical protein DMH01_22240 [Amycolatopsis sp. WAC 04182]|uniref:hypothetical protein n=1 Tax=Amycolatopsis sp. WAC 04182 TaxID=2203198 RepID=UPI000F77E4B9|nr:hypothetical protein [Amycolatopsis sp. WAC 04182]RSN58748.1 hypothetical protein DMH01_22240 [Amycolatopsis sp. WAC 04182]
MISEQQGCDLPASETGRATSAARRSSSEVKTGITGQGIRRPEPVADEMPKPFSLPPFLGMFDLPADASRSVKASLRDPESLKEAFTDLRKESKGPLLPPGPPG